MTPPSATTAKPQYDKEIGDHKVSVERGCGNAVLYVCQECGVFEEMVNKDALPDECDPNGDHEPHATVSVEPPEIEADTDTAHPDDTTTTDTEPESESEPEPNSGAGTNDTDGGEEADQITAERVEQTGQPSAIPRVPDTSETDEQTDSGTDTNPIPDGRSTMPRIPEPANIEADSDPDTDWLPDGWISGAAVNNFS